MISKTVVLLLLYCLLKQYKQHFHMVFYTQTHRHTHTQKEREERERVTETGREGGGLREWGKEREGGTKGGLWMMSKGTSLGWKVETVQIWKYRAFTSVAAPASCSISLVVWRRKEIGYIFCYLLCYQGYHQTPGYLFILSSVTYNMLCLLLSLSDVSCPAFWFCCLIFLLTLKIGSIYTSLFQLSHVYFKNSLFPFSFFSHFLIYKADSTQFQVMSRNNLLF